MTSPTKHQMGTDTRQFVRTLLLFQFGLFMSVGLITMILMSVIVSGDSTIQRNNNTMHQSIQTK